jgi:hypothetical protein
MRRFSLSILMVLGIAAGAGVSSASAQVGATRFLALGRAGGDAPGAKPGLVQASGARRRHSGWPDRLGVVFQRDVLLDLRTILNNVLLSIEFTRKPRAEERDRAMALIDLLASRVLSIAFPGNWHASTRLDLPRAAGRSQMAVDGRTVRRARGHDAG